MSVSGNDIAARLTPGRFLIIGRAGMDFYADPPGTKAEEATQFYACIGGSSANIGVAITKLGGMAALVTSVSDDSVGRFCLNQLDHYKVDRKHVKSVGGEFRNSLAVIESRVENHQSVIYRNNAADFQMTVEDVESVDYSAHSALITTGTVLACEPSRTAAFRAVELARDQNHPILFDIDYRPYSWVSGKDAADTYARMARLCDVVIGNDDEFGVMSGSKETGLAFAEDLAKGGVAIVVYKMGELGSVTFIREEDGSVRKVKTGIFPVTALKPTGAGDAFMGCFLASLATGHSIEQSVIRGSAAAAIVVSKVGCAPAMPYTGELDDFIANHPGISRP